MQLVDLDYFIAASSAGGFSRAAKSLGLASSTISRHISRLEDELGLALFERSHSGIRLTAGGEAVARHVRRALAELAAVKSAAMQSGAACIGQIRLGVRVPPLGEPIAGLLHTWRTIHPQIPIIVSEMSDNEIVTSLEARQIDVALLPNSKLWTRAERLPVYSEKIVVALASNHALLKNAQLTWTSLEEEMILIQGADEGHDQRQFFASLIGSRARFQTHAASSLSVFALVAAGFGIALAARGHTEVQFPGVVFRILDETSASFRVYLAWMPDAEEPAVGRFVAFMRDEARLRRFM
jgi:DNA-binding transcriptional LysR family regulator